MSLESAIFNLSPMPFYANTISWQGEETDRDRNSKPPAVRQISGAVFEQEMNGILNPEQKLTTYC